MQSNSNQHPRFPLDSVVRHRGYSVIGRVTHSTTTSVYVQWDDGTVGHFDGWQAGNSLRVRTAVA
jgi:hypothetical protein